MWEKLLHSQPCGGCSFYVNANLEGELEGSLLGAESKAWAAADLVQPPA